MRPTLIALTLTALSVMWGPTIPAFAQDTKVAKGTITATPAEMRSSGVVKAIGGDWVTISGKGGAGSSFEQTFKVDSKTMVYAKGASTAVAAKGGKAPFTSLVSAGDRVRVSYHKMGDSLIAGDVHVTLKATH